ncbi:MAG: hypothetical protein M1469_04260 [Bacteroidetes bacterium]|nr:hypothetical protein [Bacteroidota bacterium]
MKLTLIFAFIALAYGQPFAQSIQRTPVQETPTTRSYPIDGTPLLERQYRQAAEYVASHPGLTERMRLDKVSSWGFTVGTTHSWYVYDYATTKYYLDPSTCRSVGSHCYIFVEDSLWGTRVTQAAVDSIENDFDNRTPANPNEGIYEMDVNAFGNPPDVDNDPRIIILICNIQDGYKGTGGYIAGFFDPTNETNQPYSNRAEIYYVDADPTDLTTAGGIEQAMSTTAHEFQHMINYNYHQTVQEPTFINEGCSKLAEVYCGYPTDDLSLYANETNIYLFTWRKNDNTLVLNDYARAQRFFLYIWDRLGIGIFKYIVQSEQNTPQAILNGALQEDGSSLNFNGLFTDWLIANELNDTTTNRLYGYAYPDLPPSNGEDFYNPNVSGTDTVQNVAAEYLIFKGGSNLSVTFTNPGSDPNLSVKAVEFGSSSTLADVPFGVPFSVPDYGTTYTKIAFIVINEDPNNDVVVGYKASGSGPATVEELKWDTAEPDGYFPWSVSDTLCVTFGAYPGGVLDSVRVALRNGGSISGGVYRFTGNVSPTPLGKPLVAPIIASIYASSPFPYPVPYQNWASVELSSMGISTDQPFAVAFVIGNPDPGVMVTEYPGQNPYHSYTYLTSSEASPNPAGWYYVTDTDSTVAIYLIRAYVSFPTAEDVKPTPAGWKQPLCYVYKPRFRPKSFG